jgi:CubicO group peptidase (beta-lactamase class C family)
MARRGRAHRAGTSTGKAMLKSLRVLIFLAIPHAAWAQWTATGPDVPQLTTFDTRMRTLMESLDIPSGQLAVTWQGRLVLARGYSWNPGPADILVQPDSLFRIASVTKPITATLVNRLIQDGQLDLDDTLGELVDIELLPNEQADPRLTGVTVRNLLEHRAGLGTYNTLGYDPLFVDQHMAFSNGVPMPVAQAHIARVMNGVQLFSDPGTSFDYSNYGYMLLRAIIESAAGMDYQAYAESVLNPIGIWQIGQGAAAINDRPSNEVAYDSGGFTGTSVIDDSGQIVPFEYGGFNMTNLEGVGGFRASAVELARWLSNLDDPDADGAILNETSLSRMFGLYENYPLPYTPNTGYYAQGWAVSMDAQGMRQTWHDGSLPSTTSYVLRLKQGVNFVVSFNRRDETGQGPNWSSLVDAELWAGYFDVSEWPSHDLFPSMLPVIFQDDFD